MKFKLGDNNTCIISELDDGYVIFDCNGFAMDTDQMIELSRGLLQCAIQSKDEIDSYNKRHEVEFKKQQK